MSLLGDRLRLHARESPDARAIHADRWWTFSELVAAADPVAQQLGALGIGRGDIVALPIDRGIEAVIATCATLLAGAIPAALDPRDLEGATRTIERLRPSLVLVAPADGDLARAHVLQLRGGRGEVTAEAAADPIKRDPGISHVIFTSGSTAATKGVVWSELRAGFDWATTAPPPRRRERPGAIVVPLCTALGFQELVRSLYHGCAIALLHAPFMAALDQMRELAIDRVRLTPTHVELLLATATAIPELRVVSVAAAPITPERVRALAERVPNAWLCRSYGLTESGAATSVWLHKNAGKMHTVGRAIAYRRVTVREPGGKMLPPHQMGEVVIELPMWDASDGYLDATPEQAARFSNGVLWTGDRGFIDRHGFLVLGGRQAEILKIGGRSVSAPRIEEALHGIAGVAEMTVVGVPDRWLGEAPCAVYVPAAGADPRAIAAAASERSARAEDAPKWWLARRELPRTRTLKIRRGMLAREAAKWTGAFPQRMTVLDRPVPSYEIEDRIAVLDGCPWAGDGALDPCARAITLVTRRPIGPLAFAAIVAGEVGVPARFIIGPIAADLGNPRVADSALDVLAGELVHLATALPGAKPLAICALGERIAYDAGGFIAIPGAPGWRWRRDPAITPAAEIAIHAMLPAVARMAEVITAWSRGAPHRASAVSER